jgi:hypothetical protein
MRPAGRMGRGVQARFWPGWFGVLGAEDSPRFWGRDKGDLLGSPAGSILGTGWEMIALYELFIGIEETQLEVSTLIILEKFSQIAEFDKLPIHDNASI